MDPEIIPQTQIPHAHIEPPPAEPIPLAPAQPKKIPIFWICIMGILISALSYYVYKNQQPKPQTKEATPFAFPTSTINPYNKEIFLPPEDFKIYSDPEVNFSFRYPFDIALNVDSKSTATATLQVLAKKIESTIDQPFNFTKETAIKDKVNLQKGTYGEHIGWPVSGSEKVATVSGVSIKKFTVFGMLEVCDVRFQRTAVFYNGDYQIILNYSGPRSLIGSISNYLTTDMKNCNAPIWKPDSQLYRDLEAKSAPKEIQHWFDAFDQILGSLEILKIVTSKVGTPTVQITTSSSSDNFYLSLPNGSSVKNQSAVTIDGNTYTLNTRIGPGLCNMGDPVEVCGYVDESTPIWRTFRIWNKKGIIFALNPQTGTIGGKSADGFIVVKQSPDTIFTEQEIDMWKKISDTLFIENN